MWKGWELLTILKNNKITIFNRSAYHVQQMNYLSDKNESIEWNFDDANRTKEWELSNEQALCFQNGDGCLTKFHAGSRNIKISLAVQKLHHFKENWQKKSRKKTWTFSNAENSIPNALHFDKLLFYFKLFSFSMFKTTPDKVRIFS